VQTEGAQLLETPMPITPENSVINRSAEHEQQGRNSKSSPEVFNFTTAVSKLAEKFPKSSFELQKLISSTPQQPLKLFEKRIVEGKIQVGLPQNLIEFENSGLMSAIIHLCSRQGYEIRDCGQSLPASVFNINDKKFNSYVVGYAACLLKDKPSYPETGGRFNKAWRDCYLERLNVTEKVGKEFLKSPKRNLSSVLNELKSFTREHWADRTRISTLFSSIQRLPVEAKFDCIISFEKWHRKIKHTLPWNNGGVFTDLERQSFAQIYKANSDDYNEHIETVRKGYKDMSINHVNLYKALEGLKKHPLTADIDFVSRISAERSKFLFRVSKKKSDINFNKLPLIDKMVLLSQKEEIWLEFAPFKTFQNIVTYDGEKRTLLNLFNCSDEDDRSKLYKKVKDQFNTKNVLIDISRIYAEWVDLAPSSSN